MNKKKIIRVLIILTGLLIGCLTIKIQTGEGEITNETKPKIGTNNTLLIESKEDSTEIKIEK